MVQGPVSAGWVTSDSIINFLSFPSLGQAIVSEQSSVEFLGISGLKRRSLEYWVKRWYM